MAYYNNRNNNNRNNNNYNNNRRNNFYNNNEQGRNTNNNGFDARVYKKPDIDITDLTGHTYRISGNFSTAFSSEIIKTIERAERIRGGSNDLDKFPEMFDLLKDWCLSLLNLNVDGEKVTIDDVNRGFNDIYVLYNLIGYIAKCVSSNSAQMIDMFNRERTRNEDDSQ